MLLSRPERRGTPCTNLYNGPQIITMLGFVLESLVCWYPALQSMLTSDFLQPFRSFPLDLHLITDTSLACVPARHTGGSIPSDEQIGCSMQQASEMTGRILLR